MTDLQTKAQWRDQAHRLERRVHCAVIEGYRAWVADGALRNSDKETAINAMLHERIQEAARNCVLASWSISYNAPAKTPQILTAEQDPDTAPIPDLSVWRSRPSGVQYLAVIECKWVCRPRVNSKDLGYYVTRGMDRFVNGNYHGLGLFNLMLGYADDDSHTPEAIRTISELASAKLGPEHSLRSNGPIHGHSQAYESGGSEKLQHLILCIPARPADSG